jgi:hypothetical protein
MAVRRSYNALNQVRVSVPDIRGIESAIRSDFDELLGGLITGAGKPFVVRGFEIEMAGSIGSSANSLQVIVERSSLLHSTSATAGTFFVVPVGTPAQTLSSTINPKVVGSFTPGSLNYVGIEYSRQVDNSTSIQRYFWSPATRSEFVKTAPQAELLDYRLVISTSPFTANPNVLPLAVVETDGANNVLSVEDRRPLLFRLGTAGAGSPDPTYEYSWNNHSEGRSENPSSSSSSSVSPFRGGDKQIFSMKEMFDSLMTEIKLIKGTPFWYSESAGGSIYRLKTDLGNTIISSKGAASHDQNTAGKINWSLDINMIVVGSRLIYKILANPTSSNIVLDDNEVCYITLIRDVSIIPNLIFTQGSDSVSSVGNVPWTTGLQAGDYIKDASGAEDKYYQISVVNSLSAVTLAEVYQEISTGIGGIKAQYALGVYQAVATPSTNRHLKVADRNDVEIKQDNFWLFVRQDGGTLGGTETQIQTLADVAGSLSGLSFRLFSNDDIRKYVAYLDDGSATPPSVPAGTKLIRIPYPQNATAAEMGSIMRDVLGDQTDFTTSGSGSNVIVTNTIAGASSFAEDIDTGFTFSQISRGAKSKVYARFFGSELEQGETRQISDNENLEILRYVGARSETDALPQYSSAFEQISPLSYIITFPSAASINSGDSFIQYSTNDTVKYRVFFDKDGAGIGTPNLGEIPVVVPITTGQSATNVATAYVSVASSLSAFNLTNNMDGTVNVSMALAGATSNPENIDVTGLSFVITGVGSGEQNYIVQDNENLTKAIKRLDSALNQLTNAISSEAYEEEYEIVSGAPANQYELTGPIPSLTTIDLPLRSYDGALITYKVGANQLELFLNGQYLRKGRDWMEIGALDSNSNQVDLLIELEVNDFLSFRIDTGTLSTGGVGGGGGEANTASNIGVSGAGVFKTKVGVDLQFKRLINGPGVTVFEGIDTISFSAAPSAPIKNVRTVTGTSDNIIISDDYIRALNNGSDITLTLPSAINTGKEITIKKVDAGNTLSIATTGGEEIDGIDATATPLLITVLNESVTLISNESNWEII